MRRTTLVILLLAMVALIVAAAAPAGAVKAEKTSFVVAECADTNNPISVERFEFPNPDRILIRGMHNLYHEWVLEDSTWRLFGTNETTANGNVTVDFEKGTFWGTFDFQDDGTIGDSTGTWAWGMSALGRATGKTADGDLVKVTLGLDPEGLPTMPAADCSIAQFLIIAPNG